MAGSSRIVGMVKTITGYTGMPNTNAQFIVQYKCTGDVSGQIEGEAVLEVDVTQNDTQITTDLRTALAAYVNPLVTPPQAYAANDVRGLNV